MTSQISHVIPVLISNLIANGVARFFTPSIYDLAIEAGKLPFLPDLLPSSSAIYQIHVEDFMEKDVKFVFLGMTYNDLKNTLKANKQIKVFPFVDNPHNMILLGSIARDELIGLIERQVGYSRRMEIARRSINIDSTKKKDTDTEQTDAVKDEELRRPRLLSKYNVNMMDAPESSQIKMNNLMNKLSVLRVCDLSNEAQQVWESQQLSQEVDFTKCQIDPAPFQLVERTSLLKVHSLFSMMHLNTAYVTAIGKLVGVVGGKDLRNAIERANSGTLPIQDIKSKEELSLLRKE